MNNPVVHLRQPQYSRFIKPHKPVIPLDPFEEYECWVYDIECYPNFTLILFYNKIQGYKELKFDSLDGEKATYHPEQLAKIREFIQNSNAIFIGFNNLEYDDYLLKYIYSEPDHVITPKRIFNFSTALILLPSKGRKPDWYWKYWGTNFPTPWAKSIDVYQLRKLPGQTGSLKEQAAALGWYKLQDLPIPPGTILTKKQKEETTEYCYNDVEITTHLWNISQEAVESRLKLEEMYPDIDVISKYNAAVCEEFFKVVYSDKADISQKDMKALRPPKDPLQVIDLYPEYIQFRTKPFKDVLAVWCEIVGEHGQVKKALNSKVETENLIFNLGAGGLHTKDKPFILEACPEFDIIDVDVESFYPAIAINQELRPRQLSSEFNDLYRSLRDLRLDAKKSGRKTESDGLKITINSAFGKSGSKYSVLYDPFMQLSITVTGQLVLLMLIEMFLIDKIQVVSANTDGVICKVPPIDFPRFEEVYRSWQEKTGFILEQTFYEKYIRRDVNNYMAVKSNGEIKTKGIFGTHKDFAPVVVKALQDYFQFSIPIQTTIYGEKDFLKFCYYFQAKQGFTLYHNGEPVQKTARWYATIIEQPSGLKKQKGEQIIKVPNAENSILVNDLPNIFPTDLDYEHYIQKAQDTVNTVEK